MELKDEKTINAPRDRVYAALNDPDVLRQCIPGCQSLEKTDERHMEATAALKVGPVSAKFKGNVELTNLNPPESYTIIGEGKGGAAGFAKGRADVRLIEADANTTTMSYDVQADVGGKMAQLGGRLIDSTAKKLSGQFFDKFKEIVEGGDAAAATPAADMAAAAPTAGAGAAAPSVDARSPAATPDPAAATVPHGGTAAAGAALSAESKAASATSARPAPSTAGESQAASRSTTRPAASPEPESSPPYGRYIVIAALAAIVVVIIALLT